MRKIQCQFCTVIFEAKRSDAIRCSDCHSKRRKTAKSKEEYKARRRFLYRKKREKAFAGYGGKCQCCGEDNFEFLALDHVNGGGRKERETMSCGQIAVKVIKLGFPPEYRVLCHNCNQSLGWFGYCPHQKRTS